MVKIKSITFPQSLSFQAKFCKVKNPISLTQFCNMFGIQDINSFFNSNVENVMSFAHQSMSAEDKLPENYDKVYESNIEEYWKLFFDAYSSAFQKVIKYLNEECLVNCEEVGGFKDHIEFNSNDWDKAMDIVIDSINGVGEFFFSYPEEVVSSGPYKNTKDAVIAHLHWHVRRGEVYGEKGIKEIFNDTLNGKLDNI